MHLGRWALSASVSLQRKTIIQETNYDNYPNTHCAEVTQTSILQLKNVSNKEINLLELLFVIFGKYVDG